MNKVILATTTMLTSVLYAPAFAQVPAGNETDEEARYEPVVVTAQKREQSLDDVGMTINVVDNTVLQKTGISSPADLVKVVPGLTVAENSDGIPIFTLRGVSFNSVALASSPTVSVYMDEVPIPFSVMAQGALFDLERVEVLKGPQGTLFGQNATAGAFNYIAAKPTEELSAGLTASYGRFDTFESEGYISGPLGRSLRGRLAGRYEDGGPWQESATHDGQMGRTQRGSVRGLLEWEPSSDFRAFVNINGWFDNSEAPAPQIVAITPAVPANASPLLLDSPLTASSGDPRVADWNPEIDYARDNSFYQAAVRMELDLTPTTTLTSLSSYSRADIYGASDIDGTPFTIQQEYLDGWVYSFNQEVRVSGDIGSSDLIYIVGASYQDDDSKQTFFQDTPRLSAIRDVAGIGPVDSSTIVGLQNNTNVGIFANLDYQLTDRMLLSGGVRQSWIEHYGYNCTADAGDGQTAAVFETLSNILRPSVGLPADTVIAPGQCITLGEDLGVADPVDEFDEDNLSWRVNANYDLTPDMMLYGTISRGYKGGNYPVVAATSYLSLLPVRQEELTAYEMGTKSTFGNGAFALNLAAYYYDYQDKQLQTIVQDPILGRFFAIRNVPESTVRGFDADVTWYPVDDLRLSAAATYADSELGEATATDLDGNIVDVTGESFSLAPEWTWVASADYSVPLGEGRNLIAGGNVVYHGQTSGDLTADPAVAMDSYTTVDLRLGLEDSDGRWRVMAYGRNVFDEYHWSFTRVAGDDILRHPNMPATFGVQVSLTY